MERLLADAEKLTGVKYDITIFQMSIQLYTQFKAN